MKNFSYPSDPVDLIEGVFCINKYKSPIFRGRLSVPNILNPVDIAVNSRFKSGTKLAILTCIGGFGSSEPQHTVSEKAPPYLS